MKRKIFYLHSEILKKSAQQFLKACKKKVIDKKVIMLKVVKVIM